MIEVTRIALRQKNATAGKNEYCRAGLLNYAALHKKEMRSELKTACFEII